MVLAAGRAAVEVRAQPRTPRRRRRPRARGRRSGRARRSSCRSRPPGAAGRGAVERFGEVPSSCISGSSTRRRGQGRRRQIRAQLAAGVVQRLVEGAARGVQALGEDVDRHAVQRERHEHRALVRRSASSAIASRSASEQLGRARRPGAGAGPLLGTELPAVGLERHLTSLPGARGAASRPPRAARTCRPRW